MACFTIWSPNKTLASFSYFWWQRPTGRLEASRVLSLYLHHFFSCEFSLFLPPPISLLHYTTLSRPQKCQKRPCQRNQEPQVAHLYAQIFSNVRCPRVNKTRITCDNTMIQSPLSYTVVVTRPAHLSSFAVTLSRECTLPVHTRPATIRLLPQGTLVATLGRVGSSMLVNSLPPI
jgi:hypothetical protein